MNHFLKISYSFMPLVTLSLHIMAWLHGK